MPPVARVSHDGDVSTIALDGELDVAAAGAVAAALEEVRASGRRLVLVDLAGVGFVDLSGLRPLIAAGSDGMEVRLRNPSALTSRILDVTGLQDVLPVVP